ncbi:unnamed protein product [Camellia sinensis]
MHRLLGGLRFLQQIIKVKRSNGLNVKTVLSHAKFLLMLFFPQDGPVLKIGGIRKGQVLLLPNGFIASCDDCALCFKALCSDSNGCHTDLNGAGLGLMDAATKGALQAGKPVDRFKISKEVGEWTATNFHLYLPSEMYLTCRFGDCRGHNMCALLSGPLFAPTVVDREFSHRVKSVSMAKFNTEEVNALQAGGNEDSVLAFPNSAKSRNPFDLNDDNNQAQGPMLPSMLPVQGALPNLSAPTALLQTADTHSSHLMQPQASSYGSIPPSQIPSSGMSPSPGAFMGQQFPNNMPFPR